MKNKTREIQERIDAIERRQKKLLEAFEEYKKIFEVEGKK
jgi:F0F1-type ATP synthase membrane subunit b/b'